jgi:hypothetical protein
MTTVGGCSRFPAIAGVRRLTDGVTTGTGTGAQ